jgi:hypothetical protein
MQVLEISTREGNLAVGQLEETKKRLCSTQNQLDAMSDSHARTLSRLETAKVSLSLWCSTGFFEQASSLSTIVGDKPQPIFIA